MKHTFFSSVLVVASLSGCSALRVSGLPGADPSPEAPASKATEGTPAKGDTPANEIQAQPASASSASREPEQPKQSACDAKGEMLTQEERALVKSFEDGDLWVSDAIEGLSSEKLTNRIKEECSKLGQEPSASVLSEADAVKKRQRDGAAAALAKWGEKLKPTVASKDVAAEKAIAADFLKWHAGADIKRVVLTDADWKQNYNGLVVRNRYKNAEVVIAVKGESFCLTVPANVAQASTGTGFEKAYQHDVFDKGRPIPCN